MSHISKASIQSIASNQAGPVARGIVDDALKAVGGRAWSASDLIYSGALSQERVVFTDFEEQGLGGDGFAGPADGRYTVKSGQAGWYLVTASFRVVASVPDLEADFELLHNGTSIPGAYITYELFPDTNPKHFTLTAFMYLDEGHSVWLAVSERNGIGDLTFPAGQCTLNVMKIGT